MKKLLQSKKGVDLNIVMFSLVFAIIAITFVLKIQNMVSDPVEILNLFLAKDVALTLNAVHAIQDDAYFTYPVVYEQRLIYIQDEHVYVHKNEFGQLVQILYTPAQYPFYRSNNYKFTFNGILDASYFSIIKRDDIIELKNGTSILETDSKTVLSIAKKEVYLQVLTEQENRNAQLLARQLQHSFSFSFSEIKTSNEFRILLFVDSSVDDISVRYATRGSLPLEPIAKQLHVSLSAFPHVKVSKDIFSGGLPDGTIQINLPEAAMQQLHLLSILIEEGVEGGFI